MGIQETPAESIFSAVLLMDSEEDRARKSVEFATHPMWSVYVPTYSYGHRLVREYANRSDDAFRRLLTEQLTTSDLLEPVAAV